jgi:glycosyltransferase involved in cell wall biosynthesis
MESIKKQILCEWELICVDDGSTDELTKEILQSESCSDDRITVVYNLHKGAATARNTGLEQACGDYVIFLDSDDLYAPEMLETMYRHIYAHKADICVCGYRSFYEEDGQRVVEAEYPRTKNLQDLRMDESYITLAGLNPWTKLCKRSFLLDNHIWFQDLSSSNDVYYSIMALVLANKVETIENSNFVSYRTKTQIQISAHRNPMNSWRAIEYAISELKARSLWNEVLRGQIYAVLLSSGVYGLTNSPMNENSYQFYDVVQKILNTENIIFKKPYANELSKYWKSEPLDSGWMQLIGNYDEQLKLHTAALLDEIAGAGNILLWGYGKRGRAFAKWGHENGIGNITIYDKNMHNMNMDDIRDMDAVIASNEAVYEEALKHADMLSMGGRILNLEKYCLL